MEPGLLKSADWPLLIDIYFFLGGVAGGAFLIATIAALLDDRRFHDVIRIGYYVAFLALIPCPILLIVDLGRPARFLHMMMVPKVSDAIGMNALTLGPFHVKALSPMNAGAWALLLFGACALLAALLVFREERTGRGMPSLLKLVGAVGSVFGLFLAAYPGVLLTATARPLFINAHWLGALFVAVGLATGGAAIALVTSLSGSVTRDSLPRLVRVIVFALGVEILALALFIVATAGTGSAGIRDALGVLLWGRYSIVFWATVLVGIAAPLALYFSGSIRGVRIAPARAALGSLLVLLGGFFIKYVIIAAGQVILS